MLKRDYVSERTKLLQDKRVRSVAIKMRFPKDIRVVFHEKSSFVMAPVLKREEKNIRMYVRMCVCVCIYACVRVRDG